MKEYDVTIVGLGPTGGTLANLIALNGFEIAFKRLILLLRGS